MRSYGLKLWSVNLNYLKEAARLYDAGFYGYIELFVVPGSYHTHAGLWAALDIPFVIHAPHFDKGMNLSRRDSWATNSLLAKETVKYADALHAHTIIFHPGVAGSLDETVDQLRRIDEPRIVVENKPYYGFNDVVCVGSSPEEMEFVAKNAGVGFCLDIGHAFCAANARNIEPISYLKRFLSLQPKMFHLTDGCYHGLYDRHDHLGAGDYDLGKIMGLLPRDAVITVETDKCFKDTLDDFAQDIRYLNAVAENPA